MICKCEVCEMPLVYAGRGRPPVFCVKHGAESKAVKRAEAKDRLSQDVVFNFTCKSCSAPIPYKGYGRYPVYCTEHVRKRKKQHKEPVMLVCQTCEIRFPYRGFGTHPRYCPEHRGSYPGELTAGRECAGCHQWKTPDELYRSPKGGFWSYCRDCNAIDAKARYAINRCDPAHVKKAIDYQRAFKDRVRAEVRAAYGDACACCGETEPEFLTLDHVNNDGAEHRRDGKVRTGYSTWAFAKREGFPDWLQLLCWNCNSAKGAWGECPHVLLRERDHQARCCRVHHTHTSPHKGCILR